MPEKQKSTEKRIAIFVATSGHSGVDRTMQNLIPAFAGRGYLVDILKVRKHGPELAALPAGVRVIDLGTSHVYSSFLAVCRYLNRYRPVAMLTDKDRVNRTALLARAVTAGTPYLALSCGTTLSVDLAGRGPVERWITRTSFGKLYPYADNLLMISKGSADDLAVYTGFPRERITVVPAPVIPASLLTGTRPRPAHSWFQPEEPPVILGVGKLAPGKDYATLIRAFAKVREVKECRLVIVGKGKQESELYALAAALGVRDDVDLPGFQANAYDFMAHAALFVHTSLLEGLGFVIIEALAVGTPVVATDCPSGPREILQDGKYGPLVPVLDHEKLAEAMLSTLNRPHPAAFLKEAARPYEIERSATAHLAAMGLPPQAE
jgi:glycosyltransferase involved in cell wall biosynthesis